MRLVGPIAAAGYSQLVISYRNDEGQPADPSGYYQYGKTEWEDIEGAVEYAVEKGASSVILVGYSTGAAHVLSYLYHRPESPVRAAVLDSPNIDFEAAVDLGASQRRLPVVPVAPPASLTWVAKRLSSIRFGVSWEELDCVSRAAGLTVPILVFHGSADQTVPLTVSQRLAAARPDLVRLVIVPGAGHVRSWNAGPEPYQRRVVEFLDEMS
jgi:pimeloyl-ACP methyl ester carboxylesterase